MSVTNEMMNLLLVSVTCIFVAFIIKHSLNKMTNNIAVFTDLESDDVSCFPLIEGTLHPTKISLVPGEGPMNVKVGIAREIAKRDPSLYHVVPGLGSAREYPTDLLHGVEIPSPDDPSILYNAEAVMQVVREATHVISIKPPREFMEWSKLANPPVFEHTELWLTGSFNFRSLWADYPRDEIIVALQRMFPKKVVWIESFPAIGVENNMNPTPENDVKDPFFHTIRRNWNAFMVRDARTSCDENFDKLVSTPCLPSYGVSALVQDYHTSMHIFDAENEKPLPERDEDLLDKMEMQIDEVAEKVHLYLTEMEHPHERDWSTFQRNWKCYRQVAGNPLQFLLVDQLVPILMNRDCAGWLHPVTFTGYHGTAYPTFAATDDPNSTLWMCRGHEDVVNAHARRVMKLLF
jgi:hypothetical protein